MSFFNSFGFRLLMAAIAGTSLLCIVLMDRGRSVPQQAEESKPDRGEIGYLQAGADKGVAVCVNEAAYNRFMELAIAKDNLGLAEMMTQRRFSIVDAGTRARVISPGVCSYEVRIEEGEFRGGSGIVAREWIHRY